MVVIVVADWLVHWNGELCVPSSSPPVAAADFLAIAEWPNNTHMLPITLPRADNPYRHVQGSTITLPACATNGLESHGPLGKQPPSHAKIQTA